MSPDAGIPFLASAGLPVLNVGTFHAYRDSRFSLYQAARAFKPLMDKLDGRVAVSPAAKEYVSRYFPGEYVIIPNGINYEYLSAPGVPLIQRFADGRPSILFVGRLDKRKGFKYLMQAYETVKRAVPEVRLIAVGGFTTEEAAEFEEFAAERRLPDVHLVGRVSDEDLRSYYHTCDVVCVPSTGFDPSATSSSRAWRQGNRWSPPISPVTASSCSTSDKGYWCPPRTRPPSPRPSSACCATPANAAPWVGPVANAPPSSPGRAWPARCSTTTTSSTTGNESESPHGI